MVNGELFHIFKVADATCNTAAAHILYIFHPVPSIMSSDNNNERCAYDFPLFSHVERGRMKKAEARNCRNTEAGSRLFTLSGAQRTKARADERSCSIDRSAKSSCY